MACLADSCSAGSSPSLCLLGSSGSALGALVVMQGQARKRTMLQPRGCQRIVSALALLQVAHRPKSRSQSPALSPRSYRTQQAGPGFDAGTCTGRCSQAGIGATFGAGAGSSERMPGGALIDCSICPQVHPRKPARIDRVPP